MSDNQLDAYKAKGLTEDEAKQVQNWTDRGRPGATKLNPKMLESIYMAGYSCQEIHYQFPEVPLEAILWCRISHGWDQRLQLKRQELADKALPKAIDAQLDAVRFLSEIIQATHVKYRHQLLKYIANPEREAAPDVLPKSLSQYGSLVELLKTITTPPGQKDGAAPTSPLVSINVSNDKGTIEVKGSDVKDALKKSLGKDKK